MPSAEFCPSIRPPYDSRSSLANGQTSPGNAHLPWRLCPPHLRPYLPYSYWTLKILAFLSGMAASMRFLFVEPAFCLRLPSDSALRPTPLPSGQQFPLPGTPMKKADARSAFFGKMSGEFFVYCYGSGTSAIQAGQAGRGSFMFHLGYHLVRQTCLIVRLWTEKSMKRMLIW